VLGVGVQVSDGLVLIVSTPLAADSPRRAHARRFAIELDRAVVRSGMSLRGLARTVGLSRSALHFYREGVTMPSLETAARLADVLGAPRLVEIAASSRSGSCAQCSRPFTSAAGAGNRRYCSEDCRVIAYRLRMSPPARERAIVAERRATRYADAVAEFCRACEPEGICRTPECPLRVVSPLPIARRRVA